MDVHPIPAREGAENYSGGLMKNRLLYGLGLLLLTLADAARAATTTWAATTYGPYKSTDGGATWQPVKVTVSNGLLQGIPTSVAIAVDPLNPSNVYFLGMATGTSAVFKSTDAGQVGGGGDRHQWDKLEFIFGFLDLHRPGGSQ